MNVRQLFAGVWACAALVATRGVAQEPFPGLDAYVTKAIATWHVPGL